jgi:hypothetical protein
MPKFAHPVAMVPERACKQTPFTSNWVEALILSFSKLFTIGISCIGWVTNHFVETKFINQIDVSAACG